MLLTSPTEATRAKQLPIAQYASTFHVLQAEAITKFLVFKMKLACEWRSKERKNVAVKSPQYFYNV